MAAHHYSASAWWSAASRQRSLKRAGNVTRSAHHSGRGPRTGVTIMRVAVVIGTSGWQYRDWRGRFYPQKLPQRLWLEHYAEHFATVESNNAFYRLPELETFQKWHQRTPADFRWAVKASRFLTHFKRLRDPAEPVARLMGRAVGLQERLDAILLQLPPTLRADAGLLR